MSKRSEAKAKYGDQPQEAKVSPLNEVIMCMACQAHGTVKRQYGFRVIDEVCEQCDGEGCFIKGQGKKALENILTCGELKTDGEGQACWEGRAMLCSTGAVTAGLLSAGIK